MARGVSNVHAGREAARALIARAMLHSGEGRAEDAWGICWPRRLGRLVGQGPELFDALGGIWIDRQSGLAALTLLGQAGRDGEAPGRYAEDLDGLPPPPDVAERVDLFDRLAFVDAALVLAAGGGGRRGASRRGGEGGPGPGAPP